METLQERAGDKENSYHWIESSKHDIMIPTLKLSFNIVVWSLLRCICDLAGGSEDTDFEI